MQPLRKIWAEALLAATVDFLTREVGITHVYPHHFETGNLLKGVRGGKPPRSLYAALPKRFCFQLGTEVPEFLLRCGRVRRRLKKLSEPLFWKLPDPLKV